MGRRRRGGAVCARAGLRADALRTTRLRSGLADRRRSRRAALRQSRRRAARPGANPAAPYAARRKPDRRASAAICRRCSPTGAPNGWASSGARTSSIAPPAPTVAALPPPPARRIIKREDKPFDPVGLYVGNLKLTPYIEEDAGYASNPFGAANAAKGSALSTTEIGVGLQSNWSRNELTGQAKLGYNEYFQTPGASAPYGSGQVDYRFDVSRDLSFDTEGRFNVATETNSQLGLGGATSEYADPGFDLWRDRRARSTSSAISRSGCMGRSTACNTRAASSRPDDYTDYGLKLRAGYRLSEAVQPFAEIDGDVRDYDSHIDADGYDRASDGVAGKARRDANISEMLKGEASLGYGVREYRDPRLPDVGAPLFDASLIWSVTPLTTVTLRTGTLLQDAVVSGASADINRSYTINIDHALTERVKLGRQRRALDRRLCRRRSARPAPTRSGEPRSTTCRATSC